MGLCISADENPHGIDFEIRRESVIFHDIDDETFEVSKVLLLKMSALLNDIEWAGKVFRK